MRITLESYPGGEVRVRLVPPPRAGGGAFSCRETDESHDETGPVPDAGAPDLEVPPEGSLLDNRFEVETARIVGCRPTRFGLRGKRTLRRAGAVLEELGPPGDAIFLTGTIPSVEPMAWAAIACYSARIVHRLKAWINKRCPSKLDFYCWEWQGRGALHLHYVVRAPGSVGDLLIAEFKGQWIRLLDAVCRDSGVDLFRGADGQNHRACPDNIQAYGVRCLKSVGAYLSKYLGKGTEYCSGNLPENHFYPSRWWGVSRPLLAAIRARTEKFEARVPDPSDAAAVFEDIAHDIAADSEVCYDYRDRVGPGNNIVAYGVTHLSRLLERYRMLDRIALTPLGNSVVVLDNGLVLLEAIEDEVVDEHGIGDFRARAAIIRSVVEGDSAAAGHDSPQLLAYTRLGELRDVLNQLPSRILFGGTAADRSAWNSACLRTRRLLQPEVHAHLASSGVTIPNMVL